MAKAKLVFQSGDREGEKVKIPEDDPLVIGAKEGTRLDLDEEAASYRHARIVAKGDRYVLEDLHSETGTLLNGESVAIAPLAEGDVIQIGETRLVFHRAGLIAPPAGPGAKKSLVAPKVDLDLPPPKEAPHFDRPPQKVVKVKLHSTRKRARSTEEGESGEGESSRSEA